MTVDLSARAKLLDVREQRRLAVPLEFRTDSTTGQVILSGYAATFGKYDVYGGPSGGGWVEQIDTRAFDETLGTSPDVLLLVNHEGWPLARTKSGTLTLRVDGHGLLVRAVLDPSDPDVQRLTPKMRRRDMDEMSFAFRVHQQDWDSTYTERRILAVSLDHGDVSIVNYGMNPGTAAMLSSSDAISALAKLSASDVLEIRSMDQQQVRRALAMLKRATTPSDYKGVSNFADPGYKDSDGNPAKAGNGVKRYPLNSAARTAAAARYISMAKNRKGYTSEQLAAIESKIKAAAKKFGIEISDESKGLRTGGFGDAARVPTMSPAPADQLCDELDRADDDDQPDDDQPDDDDGPAEHHAEDEDEQDDELDPDSVSGKLAALADETRGLTGSVSAGLRYISRLNAIAERRDHHDDDELPAGILTLSQATEYLAAATGAGPRY